MSTFPVPMMFKLDCVVKFLCINLWTFWYDIHSMSTLRSNSSVHLASKLEPAGVGKNILVLLEVTVYRYFHNTETDKISHQYCASVTTYAKPKFIRMIFIDAGALSLDAGRNHASCNQCTCLSTQIVWTPAHVSNRFKRSLNGILVHANPLIYPSFDWRIAAGVYHWQQSQKKEAS